MDLLFAFGSQGCQKVGQQELVLLQCASQMMFVITHKINNNSPNYNENIQVIINNIDTRCLVVAFATLECFERGLEHKVIRIFDFNLDHLLLVLDLKS